MSTLPKSAPFFKRFFNGDWGWAHAAQEAGVWSALIGFSSFIPLLSIAILIVLTKYGRPFADNFWLKREVKQSFAMGRIPGARDTFEVPQSPNLFWTADAIADVKFPRKMRQYYPYAGGVYVAIMAWKFDLLGIAWRFI